MRYYWLVGAMFSLLVALNSACVEKSNSNTVNAVAASDGEQLAKTYCRSCHQYPEPDLLDRQTWETYVLPRMGYLYGIYPHDSVRQSLLEPGLGGEILEKAGIFPAEPILRPDQYQQIVDYYLSKAPESLRLPPQKEMKALPDLFKLRKAATTIKPPSTTLVKFANDGTLYLGDANSEGFYQFDRQLVMQHAARVKEGAVSMTTRPDHLLITVMGSFSPTDVPSGFIMRLPRSRSEKPRVVIKNLQRPVHTAVGDLNGDGQEDLVVCEFGKWTGRLSWWEATVSGYEPRILRATPGAIATHLADFNEDGKLDILALFGQGDESFLLYTNQGDGKFLEQRLIVMPPSYGSSSFECVDFDRDGDLDILYTAGDNADYPPVLKPYHGIRLFLNNENKFTEGFFIPLNGAYKAIPQDFDGDGDLDIAAISFFPDYGNRPEEGFVYLENLGNFRFEPYTLDNSSLGRWVVMDVGDWEGDGDLDIVLGSLAFEAPGADSLVARWVENGLPFVLLENTLDPLP